MSLKEPLVEAVPASASSATPWSCFVSLLVTMVGVGILSLPLSVVYCGLLPGSLIIFAFAVASNKSLQFLIQAAALTDATSYADLGGRCLGAGGRRAVVGCLIALLVASAIIVFIAIADLTRSLALSAGYELEHVPLAVSLMLPIGLLSLPAQLQQLRVAASGGVLAIGFLVLGMLLVLSQRGAAPDVRLVSLSPRSVLAIPIHALCATHRRETRTPCPP